MHDSLEDEIRKVREQANILAEEARVLQEHADERAKKTQERLGNVRAFGRADARHKIAADAAVYLPLLKCRLPCTWVDRLPH
jgi:hypothetical protein